MTRQKRAARKGTNRGAQVAKDRNRHKVVLPGNPKDKGKQLQSVVRKTRDAAGGTTHPVSQITFKAEPPQGYTFIPAGNPELTAALKEFSRQGDHKIFAVTTTPHAARHELSREVHRIGFHFPTQVVAQVCSYYGIRLTSGGKVIDESKDDQLFSRVYQRGERPKVDEPKDQVTINTEAKQTIKDLFPNIPDKDLFQIIKTAFQLGDGKVGTAEEIPLVRRAQLSVVAHIRHVYTDYDKLLRKVAYNDARHAVEQSTLARLVEWRGDDDRADEATKHAAADALREVIVISDEDDSDSEGSYEPVVHDDVRVEELATSAYAPAPGRQVSPDPSIQYPGQHIRTASQAARHYRPTQDEIAQRDLSRYAVWDQAKQDYRSSIVQRAPTVLERIYEPEIAPRSRVLVPLDPPMSHPSTPAFRTQIPPTSATRMDYEPHPTRAPSPPSFIRDHNGVLYERIIRRPRDYVPEIISGRFANSSPHLLPTARLVRTRPSSPEDFQSRGTRHYGNPHDKGYGTILPSIEGSDGLPLSPRERRIPFDRSSEPRDMNGPNYDHQHVRDPVPAEYPNGPDYVHKRRRVENLDYHQPIQEYHTLREASPIRHGEPTYRSRDQMTHARIEPRDHFGQPISPRLAPERYTNHQPLRDPQNIPYTRTAVDRATFVAEDVRENTRYQGAVVQDYGYNRAVQSTARLPEMEVIQRPVQYESRAHDSMNETRSCDNRAARERNMGVAKEFAQPFSQERRIRHSYRPQPLDPLPRQRVVEYEYPPSTVRSHALSSHQ
ncbi:uncharacterized protein A1O9_07374 [Exophiala aquamarina CBS 119918]|uniref:DUF2293 domain-containing protein n=1 Tax=Exophiala aquamarina CBS 119918 TaxID=1182545 RepID=A0A072PAQ7_9EURO|nr:uncharacterized protein A1O9_07374 [Exophiala aquamarina CBS 119918]KEF57184.1 hypothetical protein A1O9_07374 [Exophiala aquamarina CBS 119918]